MRTVIVAVAVVVALLAGALWYLEYSENPRSSFTSFAEMEAAGLIAA